MKKLNLTSYLVIVIVCSFVFMSNMRKDTTEYIPITKDVNMLLIRGDGSPGGYTGSIGDGGDTCTDCHDPGANFNLVSTINTNIPVTGYVFGETYAIDVSTTTNGEEQGYGFELTAEKADGTKVGVFDVTGATGSPKLIGTSAVTHSNDSPPGAWSFNWTAPLVDEGDITFYAAVMAADGSGDKNDETVTTSVTITRSTLGIGEESILAFDIFPNPSHDFLTIQLPNEITDASIEVFDYLGRSVLSKNINEVNNNLNLSNLSDGVYLIKLDSEGKTGVRRVIKI